MKISNSSKLEMSLERIHFYNEYNSLNYEMIVVDSEKTKLVFLSPCEAHIKISPKAKINIETDGNKVLIFESIEDVHSNKEASDKYLSLLFEKEIRAPHHISSSVLCQRSGYEMIVSFTIRHPSHFDGRVNTRLLYAHHSSFFSLDNFPIMRQVKYWSFDFESYTDFSVLRMDAKLKDFSIGLGRCYIFPEKEELSFRKGISIDKKFFPVISTFSYILFGVLNFREINSLLSSSSKNNSLFFDDDRMAKEVIVTSGKTIISFFYVWNADVSTRIQLKKSTYEITLKLRRIDEEEITFLREKVTIDEIQEPLTLRHKNLTTQNGKVIFDLKHNTKKLLLLHERNSISKIKKEKNLLELIAKIISSKIVNF